MSETDSNNSHVARLRFKNKKRPLEHGELVLTDNGQIEVRPSEEFLDELARLEADACHKSRTLTSKVGLSVLVAGLGIMALGWLIGRIGGKLRSRVTAPHSVDKVTMFADVTGGFHLVMPDKYGQTIELNWAQGEISSKEAGEFLKAARKFRSKPEENPVFR